MDNFRKTIQDHLPIDDNATLEQAAQQIAEQITKERNNFTQQYIALEQINDELRSGILFINYRLVYSPILFCIESVNHMETIDELNQELLAIKEKHEPTNGLLFYLECSSFHKFLCFRHNIISFTKRSIR
jgi:hypothetical protein